jgi:hypothetical protein
MKRWSVGEDIIPANLQPGSPSYQGLPYETPSPAALSNVQQTPLSPRNSASICEACTQNKFPAIKAAGERS